MMIIISSIITSTIITIITSITITITITSPLWGLSQRSPRAERSAPARPAAAALARSGYYQYGGLVYELLLLFCYDES